MSKTINDYSKTAAECASDELKRRFRDPLTGDKINGHRNGQTDARFTTRGAFTKLGTTTLVELAEIPEPTADVDTGSAVLDIDGTEYIVVFENNTPVLVSV